MEVSADKTFGTCEYCGSSMTLPKVSDEQRATLFNRGNHFRRLGEFDKALAIYENIVREDDSDAEAHWCCALCRFGIEYVEDPATLEFLPTCHRASFDSFLEDVDYLAALDNSDGITRRQYQKDAQKIFEVQKGILATSQNEEPFDVFICYKETDDATKERTKDSIDAQEIYYQLTNEGYRVFFSRITLEDKVGAEYEPYIFAALNSAQVMVVIGSKPEYFNAVWVKNEWSRFLGMMRKDRSKLLLPCYKNMDPYDLPEQLSVLQSYDMTKIGFIQDLIRGIKKVLKSEEPKVTVVETVKEMVNTGGAVSVAPLLKRAFIFLEDGEWQSANEYCEKVLDQEPENSQAYLGKLMAELHVKRQEDLAGCELPFNNNTNYQKALRFGDDQLAGMLSGYIDVINERNEITRLTGIYNNAVFTMKSANSEITYKSAAAMFNTIPGFKNADSLAEQCLENAEICRKDAVYSYAMSQMTENAVGGYEAAIKTFSTISGWKNVDEQINYCQGKISEIKAKEEAYRLELEKKNKEKEKAAKNRKRTIIIVIPILAACIVFVILLTMVIIPTQKYNAAVELYNAGKYEDAIIAYTALNGFKDSVTQIEKCETAIKDEKYTVATELYNSGKYEDAITAFAELDGFKDSVTQIEKSETAINDEKYTATLELYNAGKYEEAIKGFTDLDGYKDSPEKLSEIRHSSEWLKIAPVSETVFFGSFEQDNDTLNGNEDIEWIVLARENDRVLVISRYALICKPYESTRINTNSETSVTWETCSLRKYLNGLFLTHNFSDNELSMIPTVTISADINPKYDTDSGNSTEDQVFILSITEANTYFISDSERQCQATDYCDSKGTYKESNGYCSWWLRSPGYSTNGATCVDSGGVINYNGVNVNQEHFAIRPAMWINFGS